MTTVIRKLQLFTACSSSCCRYCFSIGALLIQQDTAAAANPSASESSSAAAAASPAGHALAAQSSWLWLIKRWLILHSDLILGATCFAAAMQAPSALGLLLLCSILILALQQNMLAAALRGRSASRLRQQQGSSTSSSRGGLTSRGSTDLFVDGCVIALQVFSAAWLLMVYVSQVKWVRSLLLDHAPPLLPWLLLWLGLPVSGDDLDQAQVQGLGLEQIMRYKVIMLAAAAVRSKAQQWQQQLPEAVVAAESAHGNPCPLFWPPRSAAAAAAGGFGSKPSDHHQHHESGVQGDTVSRTSGSRSAAAAAARPDSQAVGWDELEPVWRTAEQIVSPLYALGLWVSGMRRIRSLQHFGLAAVCIHMQAHTYSMLHLHLLGRLGCISAIFCVMKSKGFQCTRQYPCRVSQGRVIH